jgi:uncharacterized membrane protein (UPF0127 family)
MAIVHTPGMKRRFAPPSLRLAVLAAVISLAAIALASCRGAADRPQKGLKEINLSCRGIEISAEVARTEDEMAKGLMFRTELPDGKGMLFAYTADQRLSFWMKNTLIPLSIAFIASDGTIVEILDMTPRSLAPLRSTRSVRYALEVPQGWFDRVGIKAGDRIRIPSLP